MIENANRTNFIGFHDCLNTIKDLIQDSESDESYQRIINFFQSSETIPIDACESVLFLILNEIRNGRYLHGIKCLFYIILSKRELLSTEFLYNLLSNNLKPILESCDEAIYEYLFKFLRIAGEISKDHFIVINNFVSYDFLVDNIIYNLKGCALIAAISFFELFIIYQSKISLEFANKICEIAKYTMSLDNHPDFLKLLSTSFGCIFQFAKKNVCFVTIMKHYNIFFVLNDLLKMKSSSLKVNILEIIRESYKQNTPFNTFDIRYIISLSNHNIQAIKVSSIHCLKEIINQYPNQIQNLFENGLFEAICFCLKDTYRTQIEILQLINIIINHDTSIISNLVGSSIDIMSSLFLLLENSSYPNLIMKLINKFLMFIHDNDDLFQKFIYEYENSNYFEIVDNIVYNSKSEQFIELSKIFNNIISSYYSKYEY